MCKFLSTFYLYILTLAYYVPLAAGDANLVATSQDLPLAQRIVFVAAVAAATNGNTRGVSALATVRGELQKETQKEKHASRSIPSAGTKAAQLTRTLLNQKPTRSQNHKKTQKSTVESRKKGGRSKNNQGKGKR